MAFNRVFIMALAWILSGCVGIPETGLDIVSVPPEERWPPGGRIVGSIASHDDRWHLVHAHHGLTDRLFLADTRLGSVDELRDFRGEEVQTAWWTETGRLVLVVDNWLVLVEPLDILGDVRYVLVDQGGWPAAGERLGLEVPEFGVMEARWSEVPNRGLGQVPPAVRVPQR